MIQIITKSLLINIPNNKPSVAKKNIDGNIRINNDIDWIKLKYSLLSVFVKKYEIKNWSIPTIPDEIMIDSKISWFFSGVFNNESNWIESFFKYFVLNKDSTNDIIPDETIQFPGADQFK